MRLRKARSIGFLGVRAGDAGELSAIRCVIALKGSRIRLSLGVLMMRMIVRLSSSHGVKSLSLLIFIIVAIYL